MKKTLQRRIARKVAMTGMILLNLILSSKAPATPLDKQFIIPFTPKTISIMLTLESKSLMPPLKLFSLGIKLNNKLGTHTHDTHTTMLGG